MLPHDHHKPAHHAQLEHALFSTRSALSALHSIDPRDLQPGEHERLSRIASQLADVAAELAGDRP